MLQGSSPPAPDGGYAGVGGVLLVLGLFLMWFHSGGPGAASARWQTFKTWFWTRLAGLLVVVGAVMLLDGWWRS